MSDLVQRLLDYDRRADWSHVKHPAVCEEAAERIEQLEAALREIAAPSKIMAKGEDMETALKVMLSSHRNTAIAALAGEKKDG